MLSQNASRPLPTGGFTDTQIASEQAAFMRKVFAIMGAGLGATGLTALTVAHSDTAKEIIFGNPMVFFGLLIAELVMVWSFSRVAQRFSSVGTAALFYVYAIVNGLTLSVFFLRYQTASIESTFFITAGMFAGISAFGYVTKRNLTGMGSFMLMGLWGLILASIVNIFMGSSMLNWGISVFGVLIFTGLTAYDVQKIKTLNVIGNAGTEDDHKEAIHGALILYLDFINLFIYMLRIFGRRR
jgi:FtsH-binding integral membrane protein